MTTLLHLLSYAGGLAAFLFVTLSLASGLLWLAELIEEHSRYAKVVGQRAIYAIIVLHALLYIFDRLPLLPILFSILAHLIYLSNFTPAWPCISLASPRFLLSCALVVADHFVWFFHFSALAADAKKYRGARYRYGASPQARDAPTFMDVAAFFGICVWAVPLFLFLSLSANDNVIPSFDSSAPPSPSGLTGTHVNLSSPSGMRPMGSTRSRTSLLKSLLAPLLALLPRLRRRTTSAPDGLIAPRTPVRGSPLHSPVPMAAPSSYFPWDGVSGGAGGAGGAAASSGSLGVAGPGSRPGSASRQRGQTPPPPPRRIASEAQAALAGSHGTNPRGVATRGGVPFAPVGGAAPPPAGADDADGVGLGIRNGLGSAGRRVASRPPSPSMSLGPGAVTQEVVDAKRKAD